MKFFILGLVVLISGIPLLDINLYLGMIFIGVGAITASWFKSDALKLIITKVKKK